LFELFNAFDSGARVAKDFASGDEQHAGARIFKNISDLFDGLRRINRHIDGAETEYRQINDRPIRTVFGKQRHTIALFYAELVEPQRDGAHATHEILARNVQPFAVMLEVDGIRFAIVAQRREAKSRD
jgi:hypothetical protein